MFIQVMILSLIVNIGSKSKIALAKNIRNVFGRINHIFVNIAIHHSDAY